MVCCLPASLSSLHVSAGGELAASWLCMLVLTAATGLMAGLFCPFCALPSCCFLCGDIVLALRRDGVYWDVSVIQNKLFL